jgi:hypothetical protein
MPGARHHTVSAFLLDRFGRDTDRGRKVCMLEKASGRPTQVSPRDATVQKHFYSLDTETGPDPIVEQLLGVVESRAAPLVAGLDSGDCPEGSDRLSLSLYNKATALELDHDGFRLRPRTVERKPSAPTGIEDNRCLDRNFKAHGPSSPGASRPSLTDLQR